MKILYETPEGHLVASECLTVAAAKDVHDGQWRVSMVASPDEDACVIADNLTEQEAKMIVRKLFDYGVYTRCP